MASPAQPAPNSRTPNLRERRRRETADDIQSAALRLILAHGLTNVTTDMIAVEAGVSTRTFFNYFTNKEAAVVGLAPVFSDAGLAQFRRAERDLASDLAFLMHDLLSASQGQKELVRKICAVIDSNPQLMSAFQRSMQKTISTAAGLIEERLPTLDPQKAALMAEVFTTIMGCTVRRWAEAPNGDLESASAELAQTLRELGTHLASK